MSFLKKVGEAVKGAVDSAAAQRQERLQRIEAKKAILNRLELAQLKAVCKQYGVGQPRTYTEDVWTGERRKRTVTREHWMAFCLENVMLDQLVAFCDKRKIRVRDLLPEAAPAQAQPKARSVKRPATSPTTTSPSKTIRNVGGPPPNMMALLRKIQRDFEPESTRDEQEFETQLTIWLKHKFPGQVERQVGKGAGRVDLVLFGDFAIELKIAERPQPLRNLIGQIHGYKKVWKHVGVILLDVGTMAESAINEFIEDYAELGVPAVIVSGDLRRRKAREWVMKKR